MSPWILHDLSHVWYEKARLFLWHILRKNEAAQVTTCAKGERGWLKRGEGEMAEEVLMEN